MRRTNAVFCIISVFIVLTLVSCSKKKPTEEISANATRQQPTPGATENLEAAEPSATALADGQLQTVYFDFDEFVLRPDAKASLDANGGLLKSVPRAQIRIEGHADERGTIEYNLSLGEKRARACTEYLMRIGIPENRISVASFGEERPAAAGSNEATWAKNRRAEFKILSQ